MNDRTRDYYDLNQILLGNPGLSSTKSAPFWHHGRRMPARSRLRPIYEQMRAALRCCSTTSWKHCGHSIDKPTATVTPRVLHHRRGLLRRHPGQGLADDIRRGALAGYLRDIRTKRRGDLPDDLCEIIIVISGLRAVMLPRDAWLVAAGRLLQRLGTFSDQPPDASASPPPALPRPDDHLHAQSANPTSCPHGATARHAVNASLTPLGGLFPNSFQWPIAIQPSSLRLHTT